MSGQAKRSRVRAAIRHREQVARMITGRVFTSGHWPNGTWSGTEPFTEGLTRATALVLSGAPCFDVALARDYASRLIADGQRDNETWSVFIDWCRAQGMGPESTEVRHSKTDAVLARGGKSGGKTAMLAEWVRDALAKGSVSVMTPSGAINGAAWLAENGLTERTGHGWPAHLPAEWARGPGRVTCDACGGRGVRSDRNPDKDPCSACDGSGLIEGPRPQPGEPKVRMGRRLLAALDGQPSECRMCKGTCPGCYRNFGGHHERCSGSCQPCRSTGHNLAGVLPPIEWPSVVRRGVADGWDSSRRRDVPAWQDVFGQGVEFQRDTRSMPRGEHRVPGDNELRYGPGNAWAGFFASQDMGVESDEDFVSRRARWDRATARLPRWRRGELRHEQQRAVRGRPNAVDELAGITFERLGSAARGDGSDCPTCDGRGHIDGEICDECFGRGRPTPEQIAPPPIPGETTEQYRQRLLHQLVIDP